jgi:hypothetical protein
MEQQIAELEYLRDGLIDGLNDPDLPLLDRQSSVQEIERLTEEIEEFTLILAFDNAWWAEEDEYASTLTSDSSETIGEDEYDREGLIVYDGFDVRNEV